jgi:adenine-specific DNA-methyltransferase
MRLIAKARVEQEQALALIRRLGDLRAIASKLKRSRMTPLQVCEAIIEKRFAGPTVRAFFADLPDDERHYWIANLYALLMPKVRRKRLAAYFTAPHLAHHAIRVMMDAGIRPGHHRILDPAAGGAAFLVPLAAQIAEAGHKRGARAKTILQDIQRSLRAVEFDVGPADLSHAVLTHLLHGEIENSGTELDGLVQCADTLRLEPPAELYDAVIGNPPYGRILRPHAALLEHYRPVVADGYVNLYALFVEQALQWVRPRGVVCLHHSDVVCRRPLFRGTARAHTKISIGTQARSHR